MESTIAAKLATIGAESIKTNQFTQILSYWFGYPGKSNLLGLIFCGFFTLLVFLGCLAAFWRAFKEKKVTPPQKKFYEKVAWYLLAFPLVGLVLLTVRFLGVPWLSVRFLWVAWGVALGLVVWILTKVYLTKLPQQTLKYETYLVKKRYLPSKKKRKRR